MTEQTSNRDENEEKRSLEQNFQDLEEIIAKMEDRDVTLEDAFFLYERGMKKIKECNEQLDLVEKKMLVITAEGQEIPFEE